MKYIYSVAPLGEEISHGYYYRLDYPVEAYLFFFFLPSTTSPGGQTESFLLSFEIIASLSISSLYLNSPHCLELEQTKFHFIG